MVFISGGALTSSSQSAISATFPEQRRHVRFGPARRSRVDFKPHSSTANASSSLAVMGVFNSGEILVALGSLLTAIYLYDDGES